MKKDGEGEPSFFILRGAIEGDDRLGCPENGTAGRWFRGKAKKTHRPQKFVFARFGEELATAISKP